MEFFPKEFNKQSLSGYNVCKMSIFFVFIKMAPQKKQRATNTKGKKIKNFFK